MMNIRKTPAYAATPEEVEGIVNRFADEIVKEMGELIKSVVWFGSAVRGEFVKGAASKKDEVMFGSDIDVLILFDDQVHVVTKEVITAYRVIVEKVASRTSRRLHITTMPLTKFWDYSLKGDPILINMLRDGTLIFDKGCFGMAQKLLQSDKISPGKEAVWIYLAKGPLSVNNAHWDVKQAVMDLHWAVSDAAHSALLMKGIVPEHPEELVPLVSQYLVKEGLLDKKHLSVLGEFMNIGSMIRQGEINRMSGSQFDRHKADAHDFLKGIKDMLRKR